MPRQGNYDTVLGRYILAWLDQPPSAWGGAGGSQQEPEQNRRTLEEVAAAAGISVSTLRMWMRGSIAEPSVLNLRHLAVALGCPFDELCRAAVGLPPSLLATADPATREAIDRVARALLRLPQRDLADVVNEIEQRADALDAPEPAINGELCPLP